MSQPTAADLAASEPRSFRAAAMEWAALAADLDAAYEQLLAGQRCVEGAGQGAAVPAAAQAVRARGRELSDLVLPARRLAQALQFHADELAALRHHLDAALAAAPDGSLATPPDGTLTTPPDGTLATPPDGTLATAPDGSLTAPPEGNGGRLAEILDRARRLDEATSAAIRSARPGPGADPDLAGRPDRATVQGQLGQAPAEVLAWWHSLTPEQQEWALRDHPDVIGGLDGIPVTDRDRANRLHLDQLTATAAAPPALLALRDRLAATDDAYLLLVDGAGDGRVAVALGNPDEVRHTAVFVPGVGTDLADTAGGLARAALLRRTADATTADAGDVAVVYWLGYDPPDTLLDGWVEGPSRRGGAALAPFVEGLRATHLPTAEDYHVTAVGYSYGSTVVAEAALGGRLPVDDIVVLGSPGLHSDHASDLRLDPRHVWVGRSDHDEIRFAPGPIHGPEPADPGYGANRFTTDTSGHGGYWRPDSGSLLNQAYILAGQYDRVTLEHGARPA